MLLFTAHMLSLSRNYRPGAKKCTRLPPSGPRLDSSWWRNSVFCCFQHVSLEMLHSRQHSQPDPRAAKEMPSHSAVLAKASLREPHQNLYSYIGNSCFPSLVLECSAASLQEQWPLPAMRQSISVGGGGYFQHEMIIEDLQSSSLNFIMYVHRRTLLCLMNSENLFSGNVHRYMHVCTFSASDIVQ